MRTVYIYDAVYSTPNEWSFIELLEAENLSLTMNMVDYLNREVTVFDAVYSTPNEWSFIELLEAENLALSADIDSNFDIILRYAPYLIEQSGTMQSSNALLYSQDTSAQLSNAFIDYFDAIIISSKEYETDHSVIIKLHKNYEIEHDSVIKALAVMAYEVHQDAVLHTPVIYSEYQAVNFLINSNYNVINDARLHVLVVDFNEYPYLKKISKGNYQRALQSKGNYQKTLSVSTKLRVDRLQEE